MGKVAAGDLRERVTLLTDAPGPDDGQGGRRPGLTTEQTVWARVRPLATHQVQALGQSLTTAAYEITIRRGPAVTPQQRVRWQGRAYLIQGVTPDETREYLLLTCFTSGQQ